MVGYVQDITDTKNYESNLEILLKEVHHRVKNNLQIILSLLNLERRYIDADPVKSLEDTRDRISAMALLHENIYCSDSLSSINIKNYILSLLDSLFTFVNSDIEIHEDLDENINLNMDIAIPLGLIINELINNSIKYAFPNNEKGNLYLSLKDCDGLIKLEISDDGVGLSEDIDIYNNPTLGFTIINSLAIQIDANFSKLNRKGAAFKIEFKT